MAKNTLIPQREFPNLERVLTEYGQKAEAYYRDELISKKKNASFTLLDSVKYQIDFNDQRYEVSLNLEDYWKWIENGRGAGKFPPLGSIEKWIKLKPILPSPMKNGKLPTTKQLAYLIGRKIATKGIDPTPVMGDALARLNSEMEEAIDRAIEQDVESIMTNIVGMWHTN